MRTTLVIKAVTNGFIITAPAGPDNDPPRQEWIARNQDELSYLVLVWATGFNAFEVV